MTHSIQSHLHSSNGPTPVHVQFMFLDLTTCERCVGTRDELTEAIRLIEPVLSVIGGQVTVERILVENAAQAEAMGFVSSPTILVNGRDIAGELRESSCESCGTLCGCALEGGDTINCRLWVFRGEEYTQAPVALITESILRAVLTPSTAEATDSGAVAGPNTIPENLERFFAGKAELVPTETNSNPIAGDAASGCGCTNAPVGCC